MNSRSRRGEVRDAGSLWTTDERSSKVEDDYEKYAKKHARSQKNRRVVEFYLRLVLCIAGLLLLYILYSSNVFPYVGHTFGNKGPASDRTRLSNIHAAEKSESSPTEPVQRPSRMIEQSIAVASSVLIVGVS